MPTEQNEVVETIEQSPLEAMGTRICTLRKKLEMTQEDLAELTNVTPQFISYAESGKRSIRAENLLRLSGALHVSADYILTGNQVEKDFLPLIEKAKRVSPALLKIVDALLTEWINENLPEEEDIE